MNKNVKRLSAKEKLKKYWNHGINPITGWHEEHNTRLTGSGSITVCFIVPSEPNGFVKQ
jgi:hypothetical protein